MDAAQDARKWRRGLLINVGAVGAVKAVHVGWSESPAVMVGATPAESLEVLVSQAGRARISRYEQEPRGLISYRYSYISPLRP